MNDAIVKYIQDMQEQIDFFNKKENRDKFVEYIESLRKEIERLEKENTILRQNSQYLVKQKDELEKVINKAIEYIDNHSKYLGDNDYLWDLTTDEISELVDILKGEDEE